MPVLLMTTCANEMVAQDAKGTAPSELKLAKGGSTNGAVKLAAMDVSDWPSLSNRTVNLIASVRGVKSDAVLLKSAYAPALGPYEIDLTGATNFFAEAEALSRELGVSFAVIVDAASGDGTMRTNRTFRDGAMRQMVLKVEGTPMPGAQRKFYVRPQGSGLQPPSGARIAP
ncbi:MAG TPA: hypothetical protein VK530_17980 [Candidatus Acidoferrum sp.]|nr:hypothetical protein [Candidatus Acidoferrum sp.]